MIQGSSRGHRRSSWPRTILAASILLGAAGCAAFVAPQPVEAPLEVREAALAEAVRYIGMEYEWGGQDVMPRGIDCSGLVVNVYRYAAGLLGYELFFPDATATDMYERYTYPLQTPEPGDLVFMGDPAAAAITHVAIFDSFSDSSEDPVTMWIVDSTRIPELGIDGVSRRARPGNDGWIKGYGRMALRVVR